jgi:hypothetical protein
MAFDCLFHDVAEKLRATVAALEGSSFRNFREVLPDGASLFLSLYNFGLDWPFFGSKGTMHSHGKKPNGSTLRFLPSLVRITPPLVRHSQSAFPK